MINYSINEKRQFDSIVELIENLAEDIIQFYNIDVPLKNIEDVVEKLGGNIIITADKPDGVYKTHKDGFTIIYTPHIKECERVRFRVAQELGHLFLHMKYQIDTEYWGSLPIGYCLKTTQVCEEYQANIFAEAFLLPKEAYANKLIECKDKKVDINSLAEYFGVTYRLASDRAKHLKLIKRQDWFNTFE